jgi:hypothetical protein
MNDPDNSSFVRASTGTANGRPWWGVALAVVAIAALAVGLALLPGRTDIPPHISSDYCYILLAADRAVDGEGFTTPLPHAPLQPWAWQRDWGFLTKWPVGYAALIAGVRLLTEWATVPAFQAINVVGCALALVGWFAWVRRCAPGRLGGWLVAAAGAGLAVSTNMLLDPSTDLLLLAVLPYILLLLNRGTQIATTESPGDPSEDRRVAPTDAQPEVAATSAAPSLASLLQTIPAPHSSPPDQSSPDQASATIDGRTTRPPLVRGATWCLMLAGLLAGLLFWIRYAAVFVPLAGGVFLLLNWGQRRGTRFGQVIAFAGSAALPMMCLVAINKTLGASESIQQQLNLGHAIGFDFSIGMLREAWWNLTDLGYYDYHTFGRYVFAWWPALLIAGGLTVPRARRALLNYWSKPPVQLSVCVVGSLLLVLVGVTAVFGGKYDYVSLDRYYLPARPMYYILFAAPLFLLPWRLLRAGVGIGLLVACSWTVQQEWPRPYRRWLAAQRPATSYGEWSRYFGPEARELYGWLAAQRSEELVVVTNFPDYVALECQIPAMPIPPDEAALADWLSAVRAGRGVTDLQVLFVLEPDNHTRDYYFPEPTDVVAQFNLANPLPAASSEHAWVYVYPHPPTDHTTLTEASPVP